jgi:hypothetical protein
MTKEERKEYMKKYRETNKEKIKEYRDANKVKHSETQRIWREANIDEVRVKRNEFQKKYYQKHKEKLRKQSIEYVKNKRKTDPLCRLKNSIGTLIRSSIKNNGFQKLTRTEQILGCSYNDFKLYLESKFESWMTWENRGLYNGTLNYGWDIDHKIPTSSASNEIELISLNHYTNLQPLCSYTNRHIKRDKE